jgi:protein-disulfide isomerase/uncharacterized membrane protein
VSWPKRILVGAAIILSLLGCYLSTQMLLEHTLGTSTGGLLQAICKAGGGGCDKVSSSRWSVFPPKPRETDVELAAKAHQQATTQPSASAGGLHIPVPVLGLFYFSALAAWFIGVGCPNQLGRRWQLIPFLAVLGGNAWSAFFIYVMGWILKSWCAGCLTIHAINITLLIIVLLTCPRRSRTAGTAQPGSLPPAQFACAAVPHPSGRLAMVTIALMISLWLIGGMVAVSLAFHVQALAAKEVVDEVSKDPNILAAMYYKRVQQDVSVRPDDPSRGGSGDAPATLVIFADMTCAACKKLETFVVTQVQPQFGDRLRVVFKHYPLSGDCNSRAKERRYQYSCPAARAIEAARLQGGNDPFWKMHDAIRAQSEDLASLDYAATAIRLGLNPDQMMKDMEGTLVQSRIQEDVDLAHRLGVESTPAAFLNGREVPRIARDKVEFWKMMATRLGNSKPGDAPTTSTAPSAAHP